jgi:hypothetical protein
VCTQHGPGPGEWLTLIIPIVEEGLDKFLRAVLPLPPDVGDITFDAPSSTWSAQLSRITVNLFLYDISRSTQPAKPGSSRLDGAGRLERRGALPMVQLAYLVSAWAGSARDEHQLLGDVLTHLLPIQAIDPQYISTPLSSSVQISITTDERNRPRDIWSAIGGNLKASFTMAVTVAADTVPWELAPPAIQRIESLLAPHEKVEAPVETGKPETRTYRENGQAVNRVVGDDAPNRDVEYIDPEPEPPKKATRTRAKAKPKTTSS